MRSFRDIKRQARRDLHREMQVPALYMLRLDDPAPVPITVRIHTKFDALGDQKGTNFNSAEREDVIPRAIIWRAEVPFPKRMAIISIEAGEAYWLDAIQPPDDLTITAHIKPLSKVEYTGLPVPGDLDE